MDQLLPEWAKPFGNPDEANSYWDLVCEVTTLRWGTDIALNYLAGTATHADGRVAQVHNIARAAVGLDPEEQRRGLYNFFSMMDEMKRSVERMRDWEWAGPRLRLRLQSRWDLGHELVAAPVDEHTQWIVAIDSDSTCAPVMAEWLDDWKVSRELVWEIASAQSLRPKGMRRQRVDQIPSFDGGPPALRFHNRLFRFTGDMYTSGMLTDLTGRFQKPVGEAGALIIAPTAHQFYAHPLRSLDEVADLIAPLTVLSLIDTYQLPNPVTNSVLWYREPGVLEPCTEHSPPVRITIAATTEPLRSILLEAEKAA